MNFRIEHSARTGRNAFYIVFGAYLFVWWISEWYSDPAWENGIAGHMFLAFLGLFGAGGAISYGYEWVHGTRYAVEVVGTIVRWEKIDSRKALREEIGRLDLENVTTIVHSPSVVDEVEQFYAVDKLGKRRDLPVEPLDQKERRHAFFRHIETTFPGIKTRHS